MAGLRVTYAADLRHRVTVQRMVSDVQEPNGEVTLRPQTVATVWAEILPATGRESISGDQVSSDVTHVVTTRHSSALAGYDSSWRIVFGDRIFEVESVTLRNETSNAWLDWSCVESGRLTTDAVAGEIASV